MRGVFYLYINERRNLSQPILTASLKLLTPNRINDKHVELLCNFSMRGKMKRILITVFVLFLTFSPSYTMVDGVEKKASNSSFLTYLTQNKARSARG